MTGMNKVILIGTLADDPRYKLTQKGTGKLHMRIKTAESFTDATGTARERSSYHSVVVWGRRAEALSRFLRQGRRIAVEGRLHSYKWDAVEPPRWVTEVVADDVVLLDRGDAASAEADRSAA